jgi:hypothetical protein
MTLRSILTALVAALLLGGCSFQATLDAMVDRERQQQIISTAQTLCGANPGSLLPQMHPDLQQQSVALLPQIASQCPTTQTQWQLTTFQFNANSDASGSSRTESAVVVAGGDAGPWTQVDLSYQQLNGGPAQIISWNVAAVQQKPESLAAIAIWDSVRIWIMAGALLFFGAIIALIIWLVRRSRRKRTQIGR